MEKLKAKLHKQGGFTMVELLIVVAIIAILVAVSIPMMNSALEKSRHAVDQANVRDAIGLISVKYMTESETFKDTTKQTYYYCVDPKTNQGYLSLNEVTGETVTPKCQCTGTDKVSDPLQVKLVPPTNATTDKPTITTTWVFDTTKNLPISGGITT